MRAKNIAQLVQLEKPTAHAKILFADFSLDFNLMQPHILGHKLISFLIF